MRILDPSERAPSEVDAAGTLRFEAFLDRNYSCWRENEDSRERNAGTVHRSWAVGIDDLERNALYRGVSSKSTMSISTRMARARFRFTRRSIVSVQSTEILRP